MKKVLLSALCLAAGSMVMAQSGGISATGAYDDFAKKTEYSVETPADSDVYKGIFWWQDTIPSTPFESRYVRSGDGVLTYTIHQPAKAYEPIGVGFGEDGAGNLFTVDLSGDANVSFTLKNTSTTTIEIKVALQDINGVQLAFDKALGTPDGDLYKYEIGATGGELTEWSGPTGYGSSEGVIKSSGSVDFSYDFKNALAAEYVFNPNSIYECDNLAQFQVGCPDGTCFDYTKVKQLTITVVNSDGGIYGNEAECYTKDVFDGTVVLSEVKIGKFDGQVGTKSAVKLETAVYPNPATSVVNFGQTLTNVSVYNANGILVETLNSASSINVESFKAGVYLINSTEGATRFVVK